jgi:[ribosomal protein S5]-alanine N-acetyltransferase
MVRRTVREYRAATDLSLSVVERTSDRCLGRVGLRELDWTYRKVGSLSYWIDPTAWHQGYATEASWFLCSGAFAALGMRRVGSQALDGNRASLAVLRRLGFHREGRERASVVVEGQTRDMLLFGLFPEELIPKRWPYRLPSPTRAA